MKLNWLLMMEIHMNNMSGHPINVPLGVASDLKVVSSMKKKLFFFVVLMSSETIISHNIYKVTFRASWCMDLSHDVVSQHMIRNLSGNVVPKITAV